MSAGGFGDRVSVEIAAGVSVSCGGIGVLVSGSTVGTGVFVSAIGVSVFGIGVKVGIGVLVGTDVNVRVGMWVFVGAGVNVLAGGGVLVEICVIVFVMIIGGNPGCRVLVGGTFVRVGSTDTVDVVDVLEAWGAGENVKVGAAVGVNTY